MEHLRRIGLAALLVSRGIPRRTDFNFGITVSESGELPFPTVFDDGM